MNPVRGSIRGEAIHLFQAHVTLALCVAALVGFVVAIFAGSSVAGRRDAAMRRADLYYREHPYLDAPLEILIAVEEDNAPTFDADLELDPARFEAEQAELDAIVAEAEAAERDLPAYRLGLAAGAVSAKRVALHLFVHAGGWHLLWVLALLASGGARLELLIGRARYGALVAGASLCGALAHVALAGPEAAPLVGFSAAAAAIGGAFAVRPGDDAVDPLALGRAKRRRSPIRTATILGLLVVCLGALGGLSSATFPTIALLGGFAFGAAAMFGCLRVGWAPLSAAAPIAPEVKQALALLEANDAAGAIESLRTRLAGGADDPLAARALALAVRGRGDAPEALRDALAAAIDAKQSAAAIALWREAGHVALRAASAQLHALAQWLRAAGAPGEARGALLAALGGGDATFAMKLAREARRSDPLLALRAAERALSFPALGESDRKALADLTAQARKEAIATGAIPLDAAREEAAAAERAARSAAAPTEKRREIPVDVDPSFGAGDDGAIDLEEPASPALTTPELTAPEDGIAPDPHEDPNAHFFERGAIDLAAPEPEPAAPELPDPEIAGESALVDALHAALAQDAAELSAGEAEAELAGSDVMPEVEAESSSRSFHEEIPLADEVPSDSPEPEAAAPQPEPAAPPAPLDRTIARIAEPPSPAPPAPRAEDFAFSAQVDDLFEEEKPEPAAPPLRVLRVSAAKPLQLAADALVLEVEGRGRAKLAYAKIDAVAAAGVRGLSPSGKAVLLIDLAIGFTKRGDGELRIVRLRADEFDPRTLFEGHASPLAALRALVAALRARTRGVALPRESEPSAPFRIYAELADYEREALGGRSA